jgi:hypothetical protein
MKKLDLLDYFDDKLNSHELLVPSIVVSEYSNISSPKNLEI